MFICQSLTFFTSIIKISVTAATYYHFHFALHTVSCHCYTLYLTVSFCLHLLQKHKLLFFFFYHCLYTAASVKFLSASQRFFFQVAHASSCLLRRHKSIFRSHIGSFIIAIILKVILAMQH